MSYKSDLTLVIATKYEDSCDGCRKEFKEGEAFINGIRSCCGGCYRVLCLDCIRLANRLLNEAANNEIVLCRQST